MMHLSMVSDIIREHTDTIILSSLLQRDSYGYEINKRIKSASNGKYELNEANLYSAFRRLEDCGCISSYWGTEQSNARRKYYHITEIGAETFEELFAEWRNAEKIINKLIRPGDTNNE